MRRYFEKEAGEREDLGIDSLSQLADGQRAARRAPLQLGRRSFLLSALAHAVVLSAIILGMGVVQFAPAENESVEVEIVTKVDVPVAHSPRLPDEPAVQPSASELGQQTALMPGPAAPISPTKSAMIKATRMLSETMLSDPRSQGVTQALAQMNVEDRAVQICGLEAMGQIAKTDSLLSPELVSSYAMSQLVFKGRVVIAEGAAFQSGGIWYNLAFRCQVSPDRTRVQAFEFAIGDAIPRAKWSSLNLTSSHGWHSID